jgi:hypothetical protein
LSLSFTSNPPRTFVILSDAIHSLIVNRAAEGSLYSHLFVKFAHHNRFHLIELAAAHQDRLLSGARGSTMAMLERKIDPNFPKGQLLGLVTCASTGLPLAGAAIKLQAVKPEGDIRFGIQRLGVSDAEGNFDFPGVLAWTYYVFATLPGYVSPSSLIPREFGLGLPYFIDARRRVLDGVFDKITVVPGTPIKIIISLHAGSSISGTVFWQDGSPATNTQLTVMLIDGDENRHEHQLAPREDISPFANSNVLTDSNGNYKLAGLFTGKYIVGARVPRLLPYLRKNLLWGGVPPTINCGSLFYWTGNTPNPADAVPVEATAGKDISGVNLVLPMLRTP